MEENQENLQPDTQTGSSTETRSRKKNKHTLLKLLISILIIGALIFGAVEVVSCIKNENSNIIKKNGIHYSKCSTTMNGIVVNGYQVTGCDSNITILNIPNIINGLSIINIDREAFLNNKNLKEITLPNTITHIPLQSAPFRGCTNIEKVTMASSDVMNLFTDYGGGDMNLEHTVPPSLHYVYLSEGCTKISSRDFRHCPNIRELHIPYSVTEIEDGTNFINIGVNGNKPNNDKFADLPFAGCTSLRIFCAASSKPKGWDTYWNYIDSQNQATVLWNSY